jgi:hypothetical protein
MFGDLIKINDKAFLFEEYSNNGPIISEKSGNGLGLI